MPSYTRRSLLSSAVGLSLVGGLSTAQAQPQPAFESVWDTTITKPGEFTDSTRLSDGTLVVSRGEWVDGSPDITAIDESGTEQWTWNWPEDESDSLDYVLGLVPTGDGGVFFTGPPDSGAEEFLIGKLDAEQNVEWHLVHERYDYHWDMYLARPKPDRLIVVGSGALGVHEYRTDVFGVDTSDQSVVWETVSLSETLTISAALHQQGWILLDNRDKIRRVTASGDVDWEQTFSEPDLHLDGVMTTSAGDVVAIGTHAMDRQVIEIVTLNSDGTVKTRRTPEFQPLPVPTAHQIVADPNGGYVCSWTYGQRSEVYIGKLTEQGMLEYGTHLTPWQSEARPTLQDIEIVDETFVLIGSKGHPENGLWGMGITRSTQTPTPTEKPTQTIDSPTPTQTPAIDSPTPTQTATPSLTDVPDSTATEHRTTGTSSGDGAGFGIIGSILGTVGAGYLVSSQLSDDSE